MIYSRGIFLEHEVTKRHELLGVYFYIIFVNVAMKIYLAATGLRVTVDNNLDVIGITHG